MSKKKLQQCPSREGDEQQLKKNLETPLFILSLYLCNLQLEAFKEGRGKGGTVLEHETLNRKHTQISSENKESLQAFPDYNMANTNA